MPSGDFRVWYGNGQVGRRTTCGEAMRDLVEAQKYCPRARLSRYEGNGDWSILVGSKRGHSKWTVLL